METLIIVCVAGVCFAIALGAFVQEIREKRRRDRRKARRRFRRAYAQAWEAVFMRRSKKRLTYRESPSGRSASD